MTTQDFEVWILVDEAGDYAIAKSEESLADAYEQDIQQLADAGATRKVKVTLTVALPEVVELAGLVPPQGGASLTVS